MMSYQINLRGRGETPDTEYIISGEEYDEISGMLNKAKLIKLRSGAIINAVDIKKIDPLADIQKKEIIPKERRIENKKEFSLEEISTNTIERLKGTIKGLKQFIESEGGIKKCSIANKNLLKKWEDKLSGFK